MGKITLVDLVVDMTCHTHFILKASARRGEEGRNCFRRWLLYHSGTAATVEEQFAEHTNLKNSGGSLSVSPTCVSSGSQRRAGDTR